MNRQSLAISAGLLVVVVIVLGVVVLMTGDDGGGDAAVTGPGRADRAREIISDIQQRQADADISQVERPAANTIERPAAAAETGGVDVGGGAIAETPEPAAPAPAGGSTELDLAYDQARELQASGELDNAQVLFFFGARQGHAPSAFAYAEMNDPLHHSPEISLLAEPDAFQAFRWYSTALEGGMDEAGERLEALHRWAEEAAAGGDFDAEQLLLQWER